MNAVDKIKDGDKALEYVDRCDYGIVKTLREVHEVLKTIEDRSEDNVINLLVASAMYKLEAQLDM